MKIGLSPNTLYEFITLFVMLNPFSKIPVFLAMTFGLSRSEAVRVAAYAVGFSFLLLLFFIFSGSELLKALGISSDEFGLAGSLILLIFGIQMVLGDLPQLNPPADGSLVQRASFPLAFPVIAGPGAILTVVLLTDRLVHSVGNHLSTTMVMGSLLLLVFIAFVFAKAISNLLGRGGVELITRVLGLILSTIAMKGMISAMKAIFHMA